MSCKDDIGSYSCDCLEAWDGLNCEIGTKFQSNCICKFSSIDILKLFLNKKCIYPC